MIKTKVRLTLWHGDGIHDDYFNQLMDDLIGVGTKFLQDHYQDHRNLMASMSHEKEKEDD